MRAMAWSTAKANIVHMLQRPTRLTLSATRNFASKPNPGRVEQASTAEQSHHIAGDIINFAKIQATRPDFDHSNTPIEVTKHPNPNWRYGDGVKGYDPAKTHVEVDPYEPNRSMIRNYRLLVSGIAPRPIGFISTVSEDGATKNLAPMSYFQVIDHDPPMFVIGFSSRTGRVKDTYRNLKETGECVINTVSENMIEAVNATSIDAPYGVSEWDIAGLNEAPSSTVRPSRVQESIFSIEGKVADVKELGEYKQDGNSVASMVLIKATRFWVREDAVDEDLSHIDLNVLRPVAQLGGKSYGRITSTFELPRERWNDDVAKKVKELKISRRNA
ncbi:nitrilotriacetate monooxygenase component B [Dothidotthia symphoricarpi CBS 119687]|uniref:Nitrilotriacetate monooxygenase component B n=1 Tax=Dothidotthia symphoricarpi CBS 119687 TaxID=1392245 RepID=A0A6A6AH01_9PLEO|nr:nitrilotriacetate monooxygenase component B [Dothidotthia symphoricarpi CBS 119687]KAF2130167.1 nitrilotriacetate monooxygenase component B [Dothidotthia symphoricarpi CBS 119687]